ncbi:MAG TPA: hypothetical protein VNJ07_12680 [Chitinophagales bacterium]|nr:hypothetical protein [Chitinophagales bacterium]
MKKFISLFLIAGITASIFAQSPLELVKERVDDNQIIKNWKVGEAKEVADVRIIRTAGGNAIEHRTNVLYTPLKAILKRIDEKSKAESLSPQQNKTLKDAYLQAAKGGQIALFYDRDDKNLADPTLFTVVVKNPQNEIVFSKMLENECPYYYRWGIWYYYKTINVPFEVGKRFSVEVIDAGLATEYEFAVSLTDESGTEGQQLLSNK